jgi:protease IV
VEAFEPPQGLLARLRGGAEASAYAFGAGIASAVVGDPDRELEIRL